MTGNFRKVLFTFREVINIIWPKRKIAIILSLVISVVWGLSSVPVYYVEKLLIDKLISAIGVNDPSPILVSAGLLVIALISIELVRDLLSRIISFHQNNLSRALHTEIDAQMAEKVSLLDIETLDNSKFRDKLTKIERESGNRAWGMIRPLFDIPNYLSGFIATVGVLVVLHPLIALGIIVVSIPQFVVDSKLIKKGYVLRTKTAPLHRMWGWLNYYLVRNRNFMELKILSLSGYLATKLRSVQDESVLLQEEHDRVRETRGFFASLPVFVLEISIGLLLVFWVVTERVTVGSFQLYMRSLRSAQSNLAGLVSSLVRIYENYIYVSDLVWLLGLKPKVEVKGGGKTVDSYGLGISFNDVWFRYKKSQPWVLKGINLNIKPKENIAIVGLNGSGKSTLIKLLARFYKPQKGEIYVGDTNLQDISLSFWRKNLSVLFQEFESYPFTARESIAYGDVERISELSEIKSSAKQTGMDEFIEGLPRKYENPLDPQFDKGVRPSIGQGQRIGISRMLFRKNANIVIMDEPTASVDSEAEEKIFRELIKQAEDKILIFVTQRFSTVRLADRIAVIENGKIIELGSHSQLIENQGRYAKLFDLQAKAYK